MRDGPAQQEAAAGRVTDQPTEAAKWLVQRIDMMHRLAQRSRDEGERNARHYENLAAAFKARLLALDEAAS